MTQTEALKLALDALEDVQPECDDFHHKKKEMHDWSEACKPLERYNQAITAIKEALAQPERVWVEGYGENASGYVNSQSKQEPVAWKPIETAPKDVMILVCLPRQMNLVVRAWYNSIHNFWQTDYEGEGGITRPIYFHKGDLWHPIPPIYTTPPQRKPWVSLSDEHRNEIASATFGRENALAIYVEAIEAKLRELNEAPQRTWVVLTDAEIDQGLLRTNYAMQTAKAWRDGVIWAYHQLKDKNT